MSLRTNLVLKRKLGEKFLIGGNVAVTISHVNGDERFVTFSVDAGSDAAVARSEQRFVNINVGRVFMLRRSLGSSFDVSIQSRTGETSVTTVTVLKIKPEAVILAVKAPVDMPLMRAELINTPHVVQFRTRLFQEDPAPAA